jgi:hypothetical protein
MLTMDLGMSAGSGTRSALPSIHSRLCLYDATVRIELDKHLCHPRVESYVKADENLLVIHVRDVSPLVANTTRLFFSRPEDIELDQSELEIVDDIILMRMNMPEAGWYASGIRVIPRPSSAFREDVLPRIRPQYHPPEIGAVETQVSGRYGILSVSGDFDIFITVVTSMDSENPDHEVKARLESLSETDPASLRQPHDKWWAGFWQRSWVELGDKALEQLFYASLYVLAGAYRKAPMPGLLGFSYGPTPGPLQISPWTGNYTQDLNIQCPFFPVHALNHSELFDAYLETYDSFLPQARQAARQIWNARGAHFGLNANALGDSTHIAGYARFCLMGSYVALMHCLCWKYTRDEDRMRRWIYPFLKEILAFYLDVMNKGEDGKYHLWPAGAVELDVLDCADPVQTVSMLKICLATAIEGSKILDVDQELAEQWSEVLENLPDYPTAEDARGRTVVVDGVGIPANHHVGQAGCLHPVYPCGEIDDTSPLNLLQLYRDTFYSVLDKTAQTSYAIEKGFYYSCVWQCFFRAMTSLRLGSTDEFREQWLPMFLRAYVKPNGLVSHDATVVVDSEASEANLSNIPEESLEDVGEEMPKFEPWCGHGGASTPNPRAREMSAALIEANADFLTMMTEALLQSHNGIIRVFPGWPKDRDAQFVNLIAEGNISVSSRTTQGVVDYVVLKNRRPVFAEVQLKPPWSKDILHLSLKPKEQIVLHSGGTNNTGDIPEQKPRQEIEQAQPRTILKDIWLGKRNIYK